MTRRGQEVWERDSWVSCLYVKADFRRLRMLGETGEDMRNAGDDDMSRQLRVFRTF